LGKALRQLVRYDEASQVFGEAIELYKELGNSDQVGQVYANWTPIYHLIDEIKAWTICQEGLGFLAGSEDSPGYSRLLAESGKFAMWRNLDEEARDLCQRAVEMGDREGDVNVSADARITLAFLEPDIENSISTLEDVIDMSHANNLLKPAGRAHLNLGYFQNEYLIDLAASRNHALLAAELNIETGDHWATIPYSNAIENILIVGTIDKAQQLFNRKFMVPSEQGSLQE
jgi:tetratricopeptide (TPR) repeat protein